MLNNNFHGDNLMKTGNSADMLMPFYIKNLFQEWRRIIFSWDCVIVTKELRNQTREDKKLVKNIDNVLLGCKYNVVIITNLV